MEGLLGSVEHVEALIRQRPPVESRRNRCDKSREWWKSCCNRSTRREKCIEGCGETVKRCSTLRGV